MTLGDLSNLVLTSLQQPGASFTIGGGGGPAWTSLTNPQYSQGLVEFCVNEGYRQVMGDLWDQQLAVVTFTLTSTQQTSKYAIPPTNIIPYAPIGHIVRVFYQPSGLPYTWEFRPGSQLISWDQFQGQYTGQGYLTPYSFATQPYVCAVDPLLQFLYFYPGSAIAGDTITVDYQPLPAPSGNYLGCPLLTQATSTPLLPADTHIAIFYFAMHLLWTRAREIQAALQYYTPDLLGPSLYAASIRSAKQKYTRKFMGDNQRLEVFTDSLSLRPTF